MENKEYITALEERIAALEKQMQNILIEQGKGVTFKDCTLGTVNLEKCKNVDITKGTAENIMVATGISCKVSRVETKTVTASAKKILFNKSNIASLEKSN